MNGKKHVEETFSGVSYSFRALMRSSFLQYLNVFCKSQAIIKWHFSVSS